MTSTALNSLAKRKRERVYLRVVKGGLEPADSYAATQLRTKNYRVGDVLGASLTKLRNPKFNRLVHKIGQLCAANIDAFIGMDAHKVIKRLQLEGDICCEALAIVMPGVGMVTVKIPQSISFESMDEAEFYEVAKALCWHIAARYWPGMDEDKIEQMAMAFVDE
ncbi:MAG: hypothetical protein ABIT70_09850 [Sulfuriferula sp.]